MGYLGNEPADVAVTVGQGVIDASHIQDSSITTADIGNDAVTPNKIDDDGTGFQMGSLGLGGAVSGSDKLTVTGDGRFTGTVRIPHDTTDSFRIGASDDLELWHNGTDSAVTNANTGKLYLWNYANGDTVIGSNNVESAVFTGANTTLRGTINVAGASTFTDNTTISGDNKSLDVRSADYSNVLIGSAGSSGAGLDRGIIVLRENGSNKTLLYGDGSAEFGGNVTINKGGALFNLQEPSGSQAYLYSGGSFTAFRTTSNHPIHITANYSSADKTTFGTDGNLTVGASNGSAEVRTNRARMRHIDGLADASDYSHGDLYVNHISTGNIYMQRATTFASTTTFTGNAEFNGTVLVSGTSDSPLSLRNTSGGEMFLKFLNTNGTINGAIISDSNNNTMAFRAGGNTFLSIDGTGQPTFQTTTSNDTAFSLKKTTNGGGNASLNIIGRREAVNSDCSAINFKNTYSGSDRLIGNIIANTVDGNGLSGKLRFRTSNGGTVSDALVLNHDTSAEFAGDVTSTNGVVNGDLGLKTQQAEFKRLSSQSFSNGNLHDLTQVHQRPFIVHVEDSAGGLSTMGFPIGGSGIAYNWSMFDSDSNTWFSNQATITSTGTSGNTYHFSFNTGNGTMRIQRTNGSLSFTVRVYQIAE